MSHSLNHCCYGKATMFLFIVVFGDVVIDNIKMFIGAMRMQL